MVNFIVRTQKSFLAVPVSTAPKYFYALPRTLLKPESLADATFFVLKEGARSMYLYIHLTSSASFTPRISSHFWRFRMTGPLWRTSLQALSSQLSPYANTAHASSSLFPCFASRRPHLICPVLGVGGGCLTGIRFCTCHSDRSPFFGVKCYITYYITLFTLVLVHTLEMSHSKVFGGLASKIGRYRRCVKISSLHGSLEISRKGDDLV